MHAYISPIVDGGMPPRPTERRRRFATKARATAITFSTTADRRGIRARTALSEGCGCVLGEGCGSFLFWPHSCLRTAVERLGVGPVDITAGVVVDNPGLFVDDCITRNTLMR